jgi:hypothetical protein
LKCGHVHDSISVENHLATQRRDLFVRPDVSSLSTSSAMEQRLLKPKRK